MTLSIMNASNSKLLRASHSQVCRRLSTMRGVSRPSALKNRLKFPNMHNVLLQSIEKGSAMGMSQRQNRGFRTSVVTAALKNGIVGLPNVGKVRLCHYCVSAYSIAKNAGSCLFL